MDIKSFKPNNASADVNKGIKGRRLSAQGTLDMMQNPFLQASVTTDNLKKQFFTEDKWKNLYAFFQHKALIIRCLANILKLCLPYKISQNGKLTDGVNSYSLIPSSNLPYEYNEKAYIMLKVDMEFLYKAVKQMSKTYMSHHYIDFVAKL